MAQKEVSGFYWTPQDILTYNRVLNFVLSTRGCGKTYGFKKLCIDTFKKKKAQFIYLRRYKTELKTINSFFNDIKDAYPNDTLEVKQNKAYCNGELMGYFVPLSTSAREKSTAYPNVKYIIFDEFVIDKSGVYHYLKNEVEVFLEFFETVARLRTDVRAFLLGNNLTSINPYFVYFDTFPCGLRFTVTKSIIIEKVVNPAFVAYKQKTPFGELIKETPYGRYAIENESLRDNETFVVKEKPKLKTYVCGFIYKSFKMGVWETPDGVYINEKMDPTFPLNFAMTEGDTNEGTLYVKSRFARDTWQAIKNLYLDGKASFCSMKVKGIFTEMCEHTV